jgi:hypothetical protein
MRVFVARRRHKNSVELNRGTVSYGILIQPEPRGKNFRGDAGGWLMVLGGGKGHAGQGAGAGRMGVGQKTHYQK